MATSATVMFQKNEFVAALSDGRCIERHDWREMATALFQAGVESSAVQYEWRSGQRMITAGQQVALRAEMHRLAHSGEVRVIAAA